MLCFWNSILQKTYVLSNYLQKESLNVCTAVQLINSCVAQRRGMRTDQSFEDLVKAGQDMVRRCGSGTDFAVGRAQKRKHRG